ncbi:MAG: SDR family oxidoreductase [Bacteroidales bacterium]|nr:SDR family oxidoreductase [Bacteroidales bacterium]
MRPPFAGKVAVVTGASSGIGRATALMLAQAGADVALNYFSLPDAAEETAQAIRSLGRTALLFPLDISDPTNVETLFRQTVDQLGRVDHFVSSAVYSDREPFLTANLDGFRKTIDVSLWGAFYCLRAACQQMVKQGEGGSVVIVSSPHAQIAFPNAMAYNMAKAALDQMMRTAATELLGQHIRVNTVYPGWTDTPGERKFFSEETLQQAAKSLPPGRLATAEEIARAIVFLLDPASEYINGTILHIDGGLALPWWSKRDTGSF